MAAKNLPLFSSADLKGKLVLVRMDHNVVKKGKIKDTMRIDASIPTLREILKAGGLPIVMTHVGRPYDKKTGTITISADDAVQPIVTYLDAQLSLKGMVPDLPAKGDQGIEDLSPLTDAIARLKNGEVDYLYLPNTRWFKGEEAKDDSADAFAKEGGIAHHGIHENGGGPCEDGLDGGIFKSRRGSIQHIVELSSGFEVFDLMSSASTIFAGFDAV